MSIQHMKEESSGTTSISSITASRRVLTGIPGLDEVLCGGLISQRAYLLRGGPGSGKTTLGLQFLMEGATAGERCLCITLSEPPDEIRKNARSIGLDLEPIHFLDLSPEVDFFARHESYDIFTSAEVEREPLAQQIITQVEALKPQRVFLDAMTQFRFLSSDAFQFRKQVLSFLRFLVEQGATVMFTSEGNDANPDDDLQFMSHGIIHLDVARDRRTIRISKFRGSEFRGETHDMRLTAQGIVVFPHLLPRLYQRTFVREALSSGIPELDELLHGGLERGTISIVTGASGVGKTTLGLQFMKEAAARGERSSVYIFEEWKETLVERCEGINVHVHAMLEQGMLSITQVEPLHFTPDEFANMVRREVEKHQTRMVMIDSASGYRLALGGDGLVNHLHALCKYLQYMGVTVLLINEVEAITGEFRVTEVGISYLADNIVFLRYLEMDGELHKCIGVLKKRLSGFEKTLHEINIDRYGIRVGKPLSQVRGLLTGRIEVADLSNQR